MEKRVFSTHTRRIQKKIEETPLILINPHKTYRHVHLPPYTCLAFRCLTHQVYMFYTFIFKLCMYLSLVCNVHVLAHKYTVYMYVIVFYLCS